MILFALTCCNGHRFESWFRSGEGYDEQAAQGLIACPFCQSHDVAKAVMAPAVVSRVPLPSPVSAPPRPVVLLSDQEREARARLNELRQRILGEGEDVGASFPERARQMHDGAIPQKPIHGHATLEDAKALIDEGISVLPLPPALDDLN